MYFLITSIGAGAIALAFAILFCKHGAVLFSPEVDAEFYCMAESACIVCHQCLAHQQAQEIAWNHCTAPVHPSSIELQTILTVPTPTHTLTHHPNHVKCQGCIFTLVDFNFHNSSYSHILPSTDYMIPPALTYPAPSPLHPNSPTLGELHEASTSYLQLPGLCNEPSQSTITSDATVMSQVTLLKSWFSFDWLGTVRFLSEEDSDGTQLALGMELSDRRDWEDGWWKSQKLQWSDHIKSTVTWSHRSQWIEGVTLWSQGYILPWLVMPECIRFWAVLVY